MLQAGTFLDIDCLANGKKSVAINLKHPDGVGIVRKMCMRSDVLIEPFRKGDKLDFTVCSKGPLGSVF